MLRTVTNLGRSGLQDWLIQRISAVILAAYAIVIVSFWLLNFGCEPSVWQSFFYNIYMRIATLLALISLIAHAWIGVWTITTDYLKITWLRLSIQILVYIVLLLYLIWGLQILWA